MQYHEARERRYKHVIEELQKPLAETEEIIELSLMSMHECVRQVTELFSVRPIYQQFNPLGAECVDTRIEFLLKIHSVCVKKLHKAMGQRATCQARSDFYEAKLNPEWSYADKYSSEKSLYLSPIQEEEEED